MTTLTSITFSVVRSLLRYEKATLLVLQRSSLSFRKAATSYFYKQTNQKKNMATKKTSTKSELSALSSSGLLYEIKYLHKPPLDEIQEVLQACLAKNFEHVTVEVTDCPDLKAPGYDLMESGLGGSPTLLEIGGPPYLLPLVQRDKLYNLSEICRNIMGKGKLFAVGAGAGPYPLRNTNCEGIFNFSISEDEVLSNGSYTAKVSGLEESCVLEKIPDTEPRCALLLNLFLCQGAPGSVIKIVCKKRTGHLNFIECIRQGLLAKYEDKCVGMGGMFRINQGKAYQHVMRDFSKTPITTDTELNQWLKFYEMPARLNAVGTLITHENNLDLRLQHFHSFSNANWGGHYHYDTTPDIVEYEAYLNVADRVARVDKPVETHKFGRD